ncbi:MAG: NAD(P)-binding domain-containing protein [Proteobacteria bacterium]|nr:NAD(P)-binding domain-containing protein [Pseudomonadota bacterium]
MRILIIGGGNMGLTFVHSFLRSHIASKENVMILEKSHERAAILRKKDVCKVYGEPDGCIESADLIIFAVKPQDAHHLFKKMKPYVDPQQVFLSIMAGLKIQMICEELGVEKVIRAMPKSSRRWRPCSWKRWCASRTRTGCGTNPPRTSP